MRLLTALAVVAVLTASCTNAKAAPTAVPSTSSVALSSGLGEQRHEAGTVAVIASWLADPTPAARVTLDTHSVDLDGFDLAQLARVRLDGGAWIPATTWDAPTGGHHRSGRVSFGSLDPRAFDLARVIELEVRDVAVPSHLLRWERAR